jgi:xanthine dehydrogenase YagT iron-sulfur-binding subunit
LLQDPALHRTSGNLADTIEQDQRLTMTRPTRHAAPSDSRATNDRESSSFLGATPTSSAPAASAEADGTSTVTAEHLAYLGPDAAAIQLRINDVEHTFTLEPRVTLLDALREYAGLTGTKKGCNHGECGACTVHLDGRRVNSCLVLAVAAAGKEVTTIEHLGRPGALHPMQQAFIDQDAFQCGFCTPGQIMSAVACLTEGHVGSPDEIREWMSGNICRCSAYPQIVAAIRQAASTGE